MKKTISAGLLFMAMMFSVEHSFSQCKEIIWPTDATQKAKAEESKVLYEDALKGGQFKQAVVPLNWMLTNVPNFHSSLYIHGADIYDKLAGQEKDAARKKVYADSLLIIYDLRLKNCGEDPQVVNRKSLAFLKYYANEKPEEALKMLDKTFELSKSNVMDGTLVPYFQIVRSNATKKLLTDDQVLDRYDKLMLIIDEKIKNAQTKAQSIEKYTKYKEDIDQILTSIVTVDCDFVRKNLAPKFKQNPKDIGLAKKIFAFMLKGKCTDDPLWLQAAETVHASPEGPKDCGLAKNLGIIHMSKENLEKAETYLKEAQTLCTDGADKAEVLLSLGTLEARRNNKSGARQLYRQAATTDASVAKQAYEKIGDLYFNSAAECGKKVNQADDRLVFLLAADYYQRAGDGRKVAMAKEAFPSKEDIFLVNYKAGETKQVECWINESTTIRTRD